jgi:hypothetical protein
VSGERGAEGSSSRLRLYCASPSNLNDHADQHELRVLDIVEQPWRFSGGQKSQVPRDECLKFKLGG